MVTGPGAPLGLRQLLLQAEQIAFREAGLTAIVGEQRLEAARAVPSLCPVRGRGVAACVGNPLRVSMPGSEAPITRLAGARHRHTYPTSCSPAGFDSN
jgi:hypothetical protein